MIVYYLIRTLEALVIFAGLMGGAAVICMFAEAYARRNQKP